MRADVLYGAFFLQRINVVKLHRIIKKHEKLLVQTK